MQQTNEHKNYLALMQRLEQLHEFNWIDEDNGQLEAEVRPAVDFPCALISFQYPNFSNLDNAGKLQQGPVQIVVQMGFTNSTDTNHLAPSYARDQALSYKNIINEANKAIHNWKLPAGGKSRITRVSQLRRVREDGIVIIEVVYNTTVLDDSLSE
ncbi:hypothetical protein [Peijinzhouia sedimentorum]